MHQSGCRDRDGPSETRAMPGREQPPRWTLRLHPPGRRRPRHTGRDTSYPDRSNGACSSTQPNVAFPRVERLPEQRTPQPAQQNVAFPRVERLPRSKSQHFVARLGSQLTGADSAGRTRRGRYRSNNLPDSSSRCDSLLKRLLRYQIDALALGLGNNSQPLVKLGRDAQVELPRIAMPPFKPRISPRNWSRSGSYSILA